MTQAGFGLREHHFMEQLIFRTEIFKRGDGHLGYLDALEFNFDQFQAV